MAVTRRKIQDMIDAEALVKRAQEAILGDGKMLSPAQVGIIKLLLNKVLPDMRSVEYTGNIEGEVNHNLKVEYVDSDSELVQVPEPTEKV